jgi:hypothetical protein
MVKQLTLLLLCFVLVVTSLQAQSGLPASAYINAEGLVIDAGTRRVIAGGMMEFSHLTWSADGRYILFLRNGNALYLSDSASGNSQTLTTESGFLPATFTQDGAVIYAASGVNTQADGAPAMTLTLFRVSVNGGDSEPLGEITVLVGCGGAYPFPMDAVYNNEAGFGGRGLIFRLTAYGIVYSRSCDGIGINLFDLSTGETRSLHRHLSRVEVSPDGERVLGVDESNGALVILHLADSSQQTIPTTSRVDQLAWGSGGNSVVYSTRALLPEALPLSAEEANVVASVLGLAPNAIPQYQVSIRRVDVNNGGASLLFSEPAWAIGRLTSQGGNVYFSVISNGETWVESLANGAINPVAPDSFMQAWRSVEITLLRVSENNGEAATIARDVHQVTLRP